MPHRLGGGGCNTLLSCSQTVTWHARLNVAQTQFLKNLDSDWRNLFLYHIQSGQGGLLHLMSWWQHQTSDCKVQHLMRITAPWSAAFNCGVKPKMYHQGSLQCNSLLLKKKMTSTCNKATLASMLDFFAIAISLVLWYLWTLSPQLKWRWLAQYQARLKTLQM